MNAGQKLNEQRSIMNNIEIIDNQVRKYNCFEFTSSRWFESRRVSDITKEINTKNNDIQNSLKDLAVTVNR